VGGGAGGEASRLQHQEPGPGEPRLVEQCKWDTRRLARSGRCDENSTCFGTQGFPETRDRVVDGESFKIAAAHNVRLNIM
jgi:hypothetical protein